MNRYLGSTGSDHYNAKFDFGTVTGSYSTLDILTSGNVYAPVDQVGYSSGVITSVNLKIINAVPVGSFYIFGDAIDPAAQNAPRDFTSEQMDKFIAVIPMSTNFYRSIADGYIVTIDVNIPYVLQPDSLGLYYVFVISQADGYFSTSKITGHFTLKRD